MSQPALFDEPLPQPKPVARNVDPVERYPGVTIYQGDCVEVMSRMPANTVDAIVSDPPYGIGFMGREWDTFRPNAPHIVEATTRVNRMKDSNHPNLRGRQRSPGLSPSAIDYDRTADGQRGFQAFTEQWAREALRILKPGGYAVVCGAPRSAHRMISGLEDAGFEIRDAFAELFDGAPEFRRLFESLDAAQQDTLMRILGTYDGHLAWLFGQGFPKSHNLPGGLGTALKPGYEPIALARKPFDGTVEECVARWGTGALAIDACRLPTLGQCDRDPRDGLAEELGRWPANVLFDDGAASQLDASVGELASGPNPTRRGSNKFQHIFQRYRGAENLTPSRGADRGGASRFFYVAKPSRAERDFGCDSLPVRTAGECTDREDGSAGLTPYAGAGRSGGGRNFHPTVKPVALMRWLVRLVCPAGGVVCDPFLGSGTTGMATLLEGREFIGIEKDADYLPLNTARIRAIWTELHEGSR